MDNTINVNEVNEVANEVNDSNAIALLSAGFKPAKSRKPTKAELFVAHHRGLLDESNNNLSSYALTALQSRASKDIKLAQNALRLQALDKALNLIRASGGGSGWQSISYCVRDTLGSSANTFDKTRDARHNVFCPPLGTARGIKAWLELYRLASCKSVSETDKVFLAREKRLEVFRHHVETCELALAFIEGQIKSEECKLLLS